MAACDEAVDQRFVFRGEAIIERLQIIVPLFFGAGTGDDRRDEGRVQYPCDRELARGDAACFGVALDLLRKL
jgi:hypothetical protein